MVHKNKAVWLLYICIIALVMISAILIGPEFYSKEAKGNQGEQPEESETAALQRLRIVLDGNPNASHAFLFAAEREGYFREQGLQLDLMIPSHTEDGLEKVARGDAELALVPQPEVLLARQHGASVKSIAAIVRQPLTYLTVKQASVVHYPKQLEGKTVGYVQRTIYESIVRSMLDEQDGDLSKVLFMKIGRNYGAELAGERVDAVMGVNLYHDRLLLEQKGIPVRFIEPALYGVPSYYETVLAAEEQALTNQPELFEKTWAALKQGFRYVSEHRDEAAWLVMARQSRQEQLSKQGVDEGLALVLPAMDAQDEAFGYQENKVWSRVKEWLAELEMIDGSLDADEAYDNRLFEP